MQNLPIRNYELHTSSFVAAQTIVWSKKLQTDEILCLKVTSYPFLILVLYLMSSQGSSDAKHEKKSEPERSQGQATCSLKLVSWVLCLCVCLRNWGN